MQDGERWKSSPAEKVWARAELHHLLCNTHAHRECVQFAINDISSVPSFLKLLVRVQWDWRTEEEESMRSAHEWSEQRNQTPRRLKGIH